MQTEDRAPRRRGRPPGSTTHKRRHLVPSSLDPECHTLFTPHKLASRYQDAIKTYEKSGLTQRKMQLLRRMASSRTFALETQRGPVLLQLLEVSKLLFLTELELVGWDLYLANTQWMGLPVSLLTLLVVSGFFVKSLMSVSDISYISACLCKQIPHFQTGLSLWNRYCAPQFSIPPKSLLSRYQELLLPLKPTDPSPINYNFYVDEIVNLGTCEDRSALQDYAPMQLPEPTSPLKPICRQLPPVETAFREENALSPMLQVEDFGLLTPMLLPYSFAYYTPPQSALSMFEDLGSAFLGPQTDD